MKPDNFVLNTCYMKGRSLFLKGFLLLPFLIFQILLANRVEAATYFPLGKGIKGTLLFSDIADNKLITVTLDKTIGITSYIRIRSWNGLTWDSLPDLQLDSLTAIHDLEIFKGKLYLGGQFKGINGAPNSTGMVYFNGGSWQAPFQFYNSNGYPEVRAFQIIGERLYLAGLFDEIGPLPFNHIASTDGTSAFQLKDIISDSIGVSGEVNTLSIRDGNLLLGGRYRRLAIQNMANWNGLFFNAEVNSFSTIHKIYKIGIDSFFCWGKTSGGQDKIILHYYLSRKDITWGLSSITQVNGVISYDGKLLFAGSFIDTLGNSQTITQYSGTAQLASDLSISPQEKYLHLLNGELFITGDFVQQGHLLLNGVGQFRKGMTIIRAQALLDKNGNCLNDEGNAPLSRAGITVAGYNAFAEKDGSIWMVVPAGTHNIDFQVFKGYQLSACNPLISGYTFMEDSVSPIFEYFGKLDPAVSPIYTHANSRNGNKIMPGQWNYFDLHYSIPPEVTVNKYRFTLTLDFSADSLIMPDTLVSGSGADGAFEKTLLPGTSGFFTIGIRSFSIGMGNIQNLKFRSGPVQNGIPVYTQEQDLKQTVGPGDTVLANWKYVLPSFDDSTSYIFDNTEEVAFKICFSNSAQSNVTSVTIIDTIDVNINIWEIQETGASHQYNTTLYQCPPHLGKGVIVYKFAQINLLPDNGSRDNTMSGYIGFKIKVNPSMPLGQVLKNRAYIYTDQGTYRTNWAMATRVSGDGTGEKAPIANKVILFPQPSCNLITIEANTPLMQGKLFSTSGQIVREYNWTEKSTHSSISVADLAPGIYFLELKLEDAWVRKPVLVN